MTNRSEAIKRGMAAARERGVHVGRPRRLDAAAAADAAEVMGTRPARRWMNPETGTYGHRRVLAERYSVSERTISRYVVEAERQRRAEWLVWRATLPPPQD